MREYLWVVRKYDEKDVKRLASALSISKLQAKILLSRGLNEIEKARRFLNPSISDLYDPFLLKDIDRAVERIEQALINREKILVYGDYDVDGITSVVLLVRILQILGADVFYYIPDRFIEGYGLHPEGLEKAAKLGANLVITVDCGITSIEEAEYAKSIGIDLIITDHHEPFEDILPQAYAVVDPKRRDSGYPFGDLAGVGVALKLIEALLKKTGMSVSRDSLIKMCAIGTVADIVPLLDENRVIAKYGLQGLKNPQNIGLITLMRYAGIDERAKITSWDINFKIGPRLNAAGRLSNPETSVELFLCNNPIQAREYARMLNEGNKDRQRLQSEVYRQAKAKANADLELSLPAIVVWDREWHRGVLGIVASKLKDEFNRPAIVINLEDGNGFGSARSIPDFHILEGLKECSPYLLRWGGHSQAAGLVVREDNLENFKHSFIKVVGERLKDKHLIPKIEIEAMVEMEEIDRDLVEFIGLMEPFGKGNPPPVLALSEVRVIGSPMLLKEKHIKLKLANKQATASIDAIGWNMKDYYEPLLAHRGYISLAFTPTLDTFQGNDRITLQILDIKFE